MLTIFATPKRFEGHTGVIQHNAITSWTALHPRPEIILFGDETGTTEICRALGLIHIPTVARTPYGAPHLQDLFERAGRLASHDLLSYVNADIILLNDFTDALQNLGKLQEKFLLVGRRWDVSVDGMWDFSASKCQHALRQHVQRVGVQVSPPGNSDYFVFPRGLWTSIPAFGIGRGCWDAWLIYEARRLGAVVIDVSMSVMAIHQIHDQSSYPHGLRRWRQEINYNYGLAKPEAVGFCLLDATHLLTPAGLKRARGIRHLSRYVDTLPEFYPHLAAPLRIPKAAISGVRALRKRIALSREPTLRLLKLVRSKLPSDGITAILGLADPENGSLRASRGLKLAHAMVWSGMPVVVYDPEPARMEEARRILGGPVEFASSKQKCVQQGDVVVLGSCREELRLNLAEMIARLERPCVVIDGCACTVQVGADKGVKQFSRLRI